mmetsp:Transcript_69219/g.156464  ORF Transcript_69219/g.156464 Transcript_69219/m.156464 type:complete len:274 (-) Transcript_69219:13-834(-)
MKKTNPSVETPTELRDLETSAKLRFAGCSPPSTMGWKQCSTTAGMSMKFGMKMRRREVRTSAPASAGAKVFPEELGTPALVWTRRTRSMASIGGWNTNFAPVVATSFVLAKRWPYDPLSQLARVSIFDFSLMPVHTYLTSMAFGMFMEHVCTTPSAARSNTTRKHPTACFQFEAKATRTSYQPGGPGLFWGSGIRRSGVSGVTALSCSRPWCTVRTYCSPPGGRSLGNLSSLINNSSDQARDIWDDQNLFLVCGVPIGKAEISSWNFLQSWLI